MRYGLLISCGVLVAVSFLGERAHPAEVVERDQWFAGYMGESKLGWAHLVTGMDTLNGKPVGIVRLNATIYAEAFLGAGASAVEYDLVQHMDAGTLAPILLESRVNLAGEPSTTRIRFDEGVPSFEVTYGGRTERGTIDVAPDQALEADLGFLLQPKPSTRQTHFVSFLSLQVAEGAVTVLTDDLPEGATSGVRSVCTVGTMTAYLDAAGKIVSAALPMGVRLEPRPEAEARDMGPEGYVPPVNLGIGFGGKSDRRIDDPDAVTDLTVVLRGLPAGSVPSIGGRQEAEDLPDGIRVHTQSDDVRSLFDAAPDLPIPWDDPSLLAEERFLDVNAAPVEAATRAAVGDEHNSARAAFAIASWIDANIEPGDFVGPIRSASSVLRTGKGVCRDYAALYVAMARRAGIPSRVVIGMVYARDGFYLHSWAESYVGRWVPVDPTRPHEAFDATHITLGRGSLAEVWDTSRYTGTLTVQIESYRD